MRGAFIAITFVVFFFVEYTFALSCRCIVTLYSTQKLMDSIEVEVLLKGRESYHERLKIDKGHFDNYTFAVIFDKPIEYSEQDVLEIRIRHLKNEINGSFSLINKGGICFIPLVISLVGEGKVELVKESFDRYVKENVIFVPMETGIIAVYHRLKGTPVDLIPLEGNFTRAAKSYRFSRLYLLDSKMDRLILFDLDTGEVDRVVLSRIASVSDIAVTVLASGKELAYITGFRAGAVSVVDLDMRSELDLVKVQDGPIRIWVDPPPEAIDDIEPRLLDYLRSYRNVYVLNNISGTLAVITVDAIEGRVLAKQTIPVGWRPKGFVVDYSKGNLYVLNEGSTFVTGISMVDKGLGYPVKIEGAGMGFVDGVINTRNKRAYILRNNPTEILVTRFPDILSSGVVLRFPFSESISMKGIPQRIKLDPSLGRIYVLDSGKVLRVYDETKKKELFRIPLIDRAEDIVLW